MAIIRSFAFPFRVGQRAFPQEATDDEAIRASLIQIVTTSPGERVMRPTFGCGAFDFVFENDSALFRRNAERDVRSAITTWEPRVRLDDVNVEAGSELVEPGQVLITIVYTVIATGAPGVVSIGGTVSTTGTT